MRWVGMVLGGLLLGAAIYLAVLPGTERGRIVQVAPAHVAGHPGTVRRAAGAAEAPAGGDAATGSTTGPATDPRQAPAAMPGTTGPGRIPRGRGAAATPADPANDAASLPSGLVIPVQGIAPAALTPTFDDDRGEGRVHEALDIMAPTGTPVLAVADGHVEKLFDSDRGGLTVYQFEPTGRYAYYYAHLDRYAPGLEEGQALRQGQVIGYVGSTGNADPAAPHLHFAIFRLGPGKRWWEGTPVDPWPLLAGRRP